MAYINIFNFTDAIVLNALQRGGLESILGSVLRPNYAIYDANNNRILRFDGIVTVDFKASSSTTKYPVENGNYGSINKVKEPKTVMVSGAISTLTAFSGAIPNLPSGNLTSWDDITTELEKMRNSTETYIVETPQSVIKSLDLQDYSWKVSHSEGVSLLIIELVFNEINQEMEAAITPNDNLSVKSALAATKNASTNDMTSVISNLSQLSPASTIKKSFTSASDTVEKLAGDIPNALTVANNNATKILRGLIA